MYKFERIIHLYVLCKEEIRPIRVSFCVRWWFRVCHTFGLLLLLLLLFEWSFRFRTLFLLFLFCLALFFTFFNGIHNEFSMQ